MPSPRTDAKFSFFALFAFFAGAKANSLDNAGFTISDIGKNPVFSSFTATQFAAVSQDHNEAYLFSGSPTSRDDALFTIQGDSNYPFTSVASADFNGDGELDLAVGTGNPEQIARVFWGPFSTSKDVYGVDELPSTALTRQAAALSPAYTTPVLDTYHNNLLIGDGGFKNGTGVAYVVSLPNQNALDLTTSPYAMTFNGIPAIEFGAAVAMGSFAGTPYLHIGGPGEACVCLYEFKNYSFGKSFACEDRDEMWSQEEKSRFGSSIAADDGISMVGAPGEGLEEGSAFIFSSIDGAPLRLAGETGHGTAVEITEDSYVMTNPNGNNGDGWVHVVPKTEVEGSSGTVDCETLGKQYTGSNGEGAGQTLKYLGAVGLLAVGSGFGDSAHLFSLEKNSSHNFEDFRESIAVFSLFMTAMLACAIFAGYERYKKGTLCADSDSTLFGSYAKLRGRSFTSEISSHGNDFDSSQESSFDLSPSPRRSEN